VSSINRLQRQQLVREAEGYLDLTLVFGDQWILPAELRDRLARRALDVVDHLGDNSSQSPQVQLITLPPLLAQSVDLGFRTLPAQRLLVIAAGLLVAAGAAWTMARTRFGIWLRAAVDHADTASTLGIPIRTVQCASFAVGAALAGLGGVLGAELMPLEPYYALKYLVLVLVVVAVGGMGSIMGSLVAALSLGTIETASKYLASEWGSLFFFVAMAAMLALRPHGLLKR